MVEPFYGSPINITLYVLARIAVVEFGVSLWIT